MEGVPVAFIPVEGGYVAMATVPANQERSTAQALAASNPEGLAVLVQDASDPVFQGVKASGFLNKVKVFAASTQRLPEKVKQQVKKVSDFAKREKAGLIMSFIGASAFAGTLTYLGSSSVEGGLTIMGGLLLWYSFLNTKTKFWEDVLHKSGEHAVEGLQMVGVKLSEEGKNYAAGAGSFAVSWAANIAIATFILSSADHFTSWAAAAYFGFLANYNVWDSPLLKKITSDKGRLLYFGLQFSIAPAAEAAMYSGNPSATWILGLTTTSGLIYAIHNSKIDRSLTERARALKAFFTVKKQKSKSFCQQLLESNGEIWEQPL
jgi:hypothetical protein